MFIIFDEEMFLSWLSFYPFVQQIGYNIGLVEQEQNRIYINKSHTPPFINGTNSFSVIFSLQKNIFFHGTFCIPSSKILMLYHFYFVQRSFSPKVNVMFNFFNLKNFVNFFAHTMRHVGSQFPSPTRDRPPALCIGSMESLTTVLPGKSQNISFFKNQESFLRIELQFIYSVVLVLGGFNHIYIHIYFFRFFPYRK